MLILLVGCAYSVEDWWKDEARAWCQCEQEDKVRECVDEWMVEFEASEAGGCIDAEAPVSREEVRVWVKDYTESCVDPLTPAPQPADPEWYKSCE